MPFPSCSDLSRQQEIHLIGTAPQTQYFVMIECPPPWGHSIQQAKFLPPSLRKMIGDSAYKKLGIRFFLISNDETMVKHRSVKDLACDSDGDPNSGSGQEDLQWRILIFRRPDGFAATYQSHELWVSSLAEATVAIRGYFAGNRPAYPSQDIPARDIFVCTHGQRDRCCGCYGYPFYREAKQLSQRWNMPNLRLWQISHIGGHRFAPTLIDLPQGRYYGRMDMERFKLLALQQGDWRLLLDAYRGWSLLPKPLQCLERLLWRNQGWQWLAHAISYELLHADEQQQRWQAQFVHRDAYGSMQEWWADILEDNASRAEVMGSCGDEKTEAVKIYQVATLQAIGDMEKRVA